MALHIEHGVTAAVAAVTGVATFAAQSAMGSDVVPVAVTLGASLLSVVVAAAVTWGVLKAEHRRTKTEVDRLSGLMLETVQRLARIEAKLER